MVPVAIGLLCYLIETDREAIERIVGECRQGFLKHDAARVLKWLTEDATAGGSIGAGPLAPQVKRWIDQDKRRFSELTVKSRKIVVDADVARSEWMVTATLHEGHRQEWPRYQVVIAAEFRRGPDGWLIRHVDATAP